MSLGNRAAAHSFAKVPDVKMARSQFDRSHTRKDTFNFDLLTPCFVDEILPGDTINLQVATFMRLATQKVPIMDNMMVDFFFFFVPNRLVWDNWEKFQGAQENPNDSIDYTIPVMNNVNSNLYGSIWDKFGLPCMNAGGDPNLILQNINALPFRAHNLIWNTWFRDENLQNSKTVLKTNGPDPIANYALYPRGKRFDYFTSMQRAPQKGAAVTIPLGNTAPVLLDMTKVPTPGVIRNAASYSPQTGTQNLQNNAGTFYGAGIGNMVYDPQNTLYTDLSAASAATINVLRQAFQVQSILELDARGGTRYVEILQSHWNVTSPDFRLQRPEYLGGGSVKINAHPVAQTAPTAGTDAQAQLAAFATASSDGSSIGFNHSFVEHGYVIGYMCARADISYQQGLNRMWSRRTRFDFAEPKLQELGEQAVLNKELFYSVGDGLNDVAVGYAERYAEYRTKPSEIRGEFNSGFAQSLDYWHMAEEFATRPALNAAFIEQKTPIERAIAVTDAPDLLADLWFKQKHSRALMTYSTPLSLGRF